MENSISDLLSEVSQNFKEYRFLLSASIALFIGIIGYLSYILIKYRSFKQCEKRLDYEINLDDRSCDRIKKTKEELEEKLERRLKDRLYIIKHNEAVILINKAKTIIEFKTHLNNLAKYLSNRDLSASLDIIIRCNNYKKEEYLNNELRSLDSLNKQYQKLDNEIKEKERQSKLKEELEKKTKEEKKSERENTKLEHKEQSQSSSNKSELISKKNQLNLMEFLKSQSIKAKNESVQKEVKKVTNIELPKPKSNLDLMKQITPKPHVNASNKDIIVKSANAFDGIERQKIENGGEDKEYYVNYSYSSSNSNVYPVINSPRKDCIVWPYRLQKAARRGYTERMFQNYLYTYLSRLVGVAGDVSILAQSDCRPYEPDIAIIDFNSGCNLRIDIEIDEPYAGLSNEPTHYVGCGDENRDANLNNLGWMVIRFSEHQIYTQPLSCVAFVCRIIKNIIPNVNIYSNILNIVDPNSEKRWSLEDSQLWATQKYRQKYLNHNFGIVENDVLYSEDLKLTTFEKSLLNKVEAPSELKYSIQQVGYNKDNEGTQDSDLVFEEVNHKYTYKGVELRSVSKIISSLFPKFQEDYWAGRKARERGIPKQQILEEWDTKGSKSREIGTFLHSQIENYYLGNPVTRIYNYTYDGIYVHENELYDIKPKEFQYFLNFERDRAIVPYRTELRIFCKDKKIAGTIDLLTKNGDKYDIYDWKRSEKIFDDKRYDKGFGGLSHIYSNPQNHYKIQQNLYRWILEKEYNIKIGNMYLVVMHPSFENYRIIEVPRMDREIKYIVDNL